jgi:hypothetical protein
MGQDEIIKKNLDLHAEWIRYVFGHPEVLEQIPQGAELIIIPNNDPELAQENQRTADDLKTRGLPFVVIHIDLPKPPQPEIEIFAAH